jgi:hypothetical protein
VDTAADWGRMYGEAVWASGVLVGCPEGSELPGMGKAMGPRCSGFPEAGWISGAAGKMVGCALDEMPVVVYPKTRSAGGSCR